MIYLDHNATSPLRPEAGQALASALSVGNASSVHASGRSARRLIEESRDAVASLAGAEATNVAFTSGATEANASALWGAVHGALDQEARLTRLFVSGLEHPSMRATAEAIAARVAGIRLATIPVLHDGQIDVEALRVLLREGKGRALVATMAVNNETGVVQPLEAIGKRVNDAGALWLVDAVQAAGKIAIDFAAWGADYLTLSAHKIGGLAGSGALIVKDGAPFAPMIAGGGQERARRAGTENVVGIATFGAAARAVAGLGDIARQSALRDRFERELSRRWPGVAIFGKASPRIGNTSNFAIPGTTAETAIPALDLDGICASSGAACSSGKVRASHVLTAMGVADALAAGAMRFSFGWSSQESDVDAALASLEKFVSRAIARTAA